VVSVKKNLIEMKMQVVFQDAPICLIHISINAETAE